MAMGRVILRVAEVLLLTALILAPRCANYQDVFVGGNFYFTDSDCYSRMTRVRICEQHPGLILRHHDFENFPQGTNPHTTAPFDYLILGLSALLKPFAPRAIDLAGAISSPLIAVLGGIFFCWWSHRMKLRLRWALFILFAISPILVHGTLLGRPDHQSLLVLLVGIALCSEWALRTEASRLWSIIAAAAWAAAIWISAYEPLILLVLLLLTDLLLNRRLFLARQHRVSWIVFGGVLLLAFAIERRVPALAIFHTDANFTNWSRTIGELMPVAPINSIWFGWTGYMILVVPVLIWMVWRSGRNENKTDAAATEDKSFPTFLVVLLGLTYCLTIWQARWAYFFVLVFAIALPALFPVIKSRPAVWVAFALSLFPILQYWDERIWPNESEFSRRLQARHEAIELRELALNFMSVQRQPFLAPWWISPAIAYWSGQPGVAGSSHESLPGIIDSARFFLTQDFGTARSIIQARQVAWVLSYDADRVEKNSAEILGAAVPPEPLARILDQRPARTPNFLIFSGQNGTGKSFEVVNKW